MKIRSVVLCAVVVCLALPAATAFGAMKPGKWQVSMQTEIPGMPFKMPAVKIVQCITEEQAKNPEAALPKGNEGKKGSSCTVSNYKVDGSTVTYDISCPKEKMTGDGKFTIGEDTYDGVLSMNTGDTTMTMKYTGKFVGACDGK